MTRPALDGLALALLDGELSLKPSTVAGANDPNLHSSQAVESITVTKARHIGKPTPLTISFNPWLNAIIGGRGTGKSTIVDMVRLTLRRESELGDEGGGSLRSSFDNRMRVPPSRRDEGLLTDETAIEVIYRREGERFAITWDRARNEWQIARIDGLDRVPEEGAVGERFPIRIYSQKQLFDVAQAPNALLQVIDDTDQVRGDDLARRRHEAESRYLSLMAEVRSLRTEASEIGARRATLADLQRKIDLLEQQGNAAILSDYRLRKEQSDLWTETREGIVEVVDALESSIPALDNPLPKEGAETDPASQGLDDAISRSRVVVQQIAETLRSAVTTARQSLQTIETGPGYLRWRQSADEAEARYGGLNAQLTEAGIVNADAYGELLRRRTATGAEIRAYEEKIDLAAVKEKEAREALRKYRDVRGELTARRALFAARTSSDLTRVEIREFSDVSDCESFIREALGIERFDEDHAQLSKAIVGSGRQGAAWSYAQLDDLVARLRAFASDTRAQWRGASDHRFDSALRRLKPERVDRLALYAPGDTVEVSFSDPRRGRDQWQRLAQGSPGQQTAALLAFVLGYGEEPIILDQPEDDLDSTLIYDLLVQKLRASKQTRQVIVVTHNPNIVVHGDAELVTSLEAVTGQTHVRCAGSLQELAVREEVCRVMEGGKDAFDLRYRRIRQSAGPTEATGRQRPPHSPRAARGGAPTESLPSAG